MFVSGKRFTDLQLHTTSLRMYYYIRVLHVTSSLSLYILLLESNKPSIKSIDPLCNELIRIAYFQDINAVTKNYREYHEAPNFQ